MEIKNLYAEFISRLCWLVVVEKKGRACQLVLYLAARKGVWVHLELWYLINGLAVILVIVLLAPISFDIRGGYFQELHLQGRICWAGGLAGLEVVYSQGKN